MIRHVVTWLAIASLVLFSAGAEASPLPVDGSAFPAIASGRPPSAEHPRGTVVVVHVRALREAAAFEWDVARERVVIQRTLGPIPDASVVRAVRAGRWIHAVFGATSGDAPVTLMRIAEDLGVMAQETIGRGSMPSIDADASTVATAFFMDRTPASTPRGRGVVLAPPGVVLQVQVRDPDSLRLVHRRVLDPLLAPHGMPGRAARAVALHGGRLLVALPLRNATRIVTASIPRLEIEDTLTFPWEAEPFGSVALVRAGAGVIALGGEHPVEVAGRPSLDARARRAFEEGDDAVLVGRTVHRLTHDAAGRTEIETTR